ncbi:MAG: energy transducer TonB, partial [Bacteroidales bacterium]|nr:energy transducer TonB [Bacteroidales bacterium]
PGGQEALKQFIAEKVVYPEDAKKEGIQGKVYVSFTVDKKGGITDTKIERGVGTSLDKEALRVTKSMPAWQPGKQDGNLVNVRFTMPIHFALASNDEE